MKLALATVLAASVTTLVACYPATALEQNEAEIRNLCRETMMIDQLYSPHGKHMLFNAKSDDGRSELHYGVVGEIGSLNLHQLAADADRRMARWSWDGTRVAYLSPSASKDARLYIAKLGEGSGRLVEGVEATPLAYAWSPDGKFIAYTTEKKGARQLFLAPVDGGRAHRLSSPGFRHVGEEIAWTMDSRGLLMLPRFPTAAELASYGEPRCDGDIWVVPVDGSEPRLFARTANGD